MEWKLLDESEMEQEQIVIKEMATAFVDRATTTRPDLASEDQLDKLINQFIKTGNYNDIGKGNSYKRENLST